MATHLNLLDIIDVSVIEARLLPFLPWNDLLRFRRVCKMTHRIITKYCQVFPERAPEIQIEEEGDRSIQAFLDMAIPSTKIFFNNVSGLDFYERNQADMDNFLMEYGMLVTSLRVRQMSLYLCIYGREKKVLDSFPNLLHFEAGYFGLGHLRQNQSGFIEDPTVMRGVAHGYPHRFGYLKSVKIGQNPDVPICNVIARMNGFYGELSQLEYISFPFSPYINGNLSAALKGPPPSAEFEPYNSYWYAFSFVKAGIILRKTRFPENLNRLQVDFASYHGNDFAIYGIRVFAELCGKCLETGVKLRNVGASWFQARSELDTPDLGQVVVSMVNLHSSILTLEMPNLESVEIKATSESGIPSEQEWGRERAEWPTLKRLDITVDSKSVPEGRISQEGRIIMVTLLTRNIFDFCFKGIRRLALVELRLNFKKDDIVVIPKMGDIVDSCPNLKKLTLVNWPGTNKSLLKLWEALTGLEEISLESCINVGNVTFVGLDTQNPLIFKLKNLKKLSFKGLDKMPKITDLLFSMVLRHLSLTHFLITSDEPVKSVTISGIRSLLEGKFAASIEKFSFNNWSLEGVSEAEFNLLETQFRSYQMI